MKKRIINLVSILGAVFALAWIGWRGAVLCGFSSHDNEQKLPTDDASAFVLLTDVVPELALSQLTSEQKQLVRPLAMPVPVREVVLSVAPDFVRHRMASLLETAVKESVPQEMLRFRNTHVRI